MASGERMLLLDGPAHEAGAGVAGPEGAVAVEDGDNRGEVQDGGVELGGGKYFYRLRGSVRSNSIASFLRCEDQGSPPLPPTCMINKTNSLQRMIQKTSELPANRSIHCS